MKRSSSFSSELVGIVRDLGSDAMHSLEYWRHNLKGNAVSKRYFSGKSPHPPVILLQGFMGTRGVLRPLENYLRSMNRDVISLDLGFFNVSDIRKSSEHLSYKVERILDRFFEAHPNGKVDIIGHSMGGLIGLHYVKRMGGHRIVRKLITLGAPFNGTWVSLLALIPFGLFSKGIWQMLPKSRFLKSLQANPGEVHETEVISIAANYDTICPPKSCELHGAVNLSFPVGHAGLLLDHRVYEAIENFLGKNPNAQSKVLAFKSRS